MFQPTIGMAILAISLLSYLSNWLNWRFLNFKIVQWLYYLGAFVHETSHALLCILTGAKISRYKVFSRQPQVAHSQPKIPILGNLLIALAPIFGGLFFIFLLNKYLLVSHFTMPEFSNWKFFFQDLWQLWRQVSFWKWQTYLLIFLFLNMGAMIGPSSQDLKNIWFILIILFFIPFSPLLSLGFLAIALILTNILIQIILILLVKLIRILFKG